MASGDVVLTVTNARLTSENEDGQNTQVQLKHVESNVTMFQADLNVLNYVYSGWSAGEGPLRFSTGYTVTITEE